MIPKELEETINLDSHFLRIRHGVPGERCFVSLCKAAKIPVVHRFASLSATNCRDFDCGKKSVWETCQDLLP